MASTSVNEVVDQLEALTIESGGKVAENYTVPTIADQAETKDSTVTDSFKTKDSTVTDTTPPVPLVDASLIGLFTSRMVIPELFSGVLNAAKIGVRTYVVVKGNPDTGKTYIADHLLESAITNKVNAVLFRAPVVYPPINPERLVIYDLDANAKLKIASDRNQLITLIYTTNSKPILPFYYGLFMDTTTLVTLATEHELALTQTKPLHVTVKFAGGKAVDIPRSDLLGSVVKLTINGFSINPAGTCFITSCTDLPGNHITLSTNEGFSPVNVGEQITVTNMVTLEKPLTIEAVYMPFWY